MKSQKRRTDLQSICTRCPVTNTRRGNTATNIFLPKSSLSKFSVKSIGRRIANLNLLQQIRELYKSYQQHNILSWKLIIISRAQMRFIHHHYTWELNKDQSMSTLHVETKMTWLVNSPYTVRGNKCYNRSPVLTDLTQHSSYLIISIKRIENRCG
jgi:hypothetical protein